MTYSKEQIKSILPSVEDCKLFSESTRESVVAQMKELETAIQETYSGKVFTNIVFDAIDDRKFRCSLSIRFIRLDHWFHFISFEKKLEEKFPVELFAFGDYLSFGVANNMDEFEEILKNIIVNEKTEYLILSNL